MDETDAEVVEKLRRRAATRAHGGDCEYSALAHILDVTIVTYHVADVGERMNVFEPERPWRVATLAEALRSAASAGRRLVLLQNEGRGWGAHWQAWVPPAAGGRRDRYDHSAAEWLQLRLNAA